ncbi:MAG: major capsid protein [Oribacterium sp.]|nr:major capsid protein [Oribacterium sp.]
MRKVIILCDRCGAEIRNVPKRFSVKEVRDAAGDHPTITPVEGEMDGMDFCESCFRAVTDFMMHWKTAAKDPAPAAKAAGSAVKPAAGSAEKATAPETKTAVPETKAAAAPEGKSATEAEKGGIAEIYRDEIEMFLGQKRSAKWIAEKLNRYGVGYSAALDAVEEVKAAIEAKLVRKIVKR